MFAVVIINVASGERRGLEGSTFVFLCWFVVANIWVSTNTLRWRTPRRCRWSLLIAPCCTLRRDSTAATAAAAFPRRTSLAMAPRLHLYNNVTLLRVGALYIAAAAAAFKKAGATACLPARAKAHTQISLACSQRLLLAACLLFFSSCPPPPARARRISACASRLLAFASSPHPVPATNVGGEHPLDK